MRFFSVLITVLIANLNLAESAFDEASRITRNSLRESAASQLHINNLDDETRRLLTQQQILHKQNAALSSYLKQMQALVANQQQSIDALQQSIAEAGNIRRSVLPLAHEMVDALQQFVLNDIPFRQRQRLDAVDDLRALLDDADVSVPLKFQRVLEHYEIEYGYGRAVTAWRAPLADGSDQLVDFLHIGRSVFAYRHLDASKAMLWDEASESWQPLAGGYDRYLEHAFRIAHRNAVPDLLILPMLPPRLTAPQ